MTASDIVDFVDFFYPLLSSIAICLLLIFGFMVWLDK